MTNPRTAAGLTAKTPQSRPSRTKKHALYTASLLACALLAAACVGGSSQAKKAATPAQEADPRRGSCITVDLSLIHI